MIRRKAAQFPSPFFPEELELDPEKALWVPGKKTIFVPSLKQVEFICWEGLDVGKDKSFDKVFLFTQEMFQEAVNKIWGEARDVVARRREIEEREYAYERVCECVPGRSRFITSPREVPVTYNDIRRSTVPQWISSYGSNNNE